jgi:hypothetical protein
VSDLPPETASLTILNFYIAVRQAVLDGKEFVPPLMLEGGAASAAGVVSPSRRITPLPEAPLALPPPLSPFAEGEQSAYV